MAKRKKRNLEQRIDIFYINPSINEKGRFISYCDYWRHHGVLNTRKAKSCRKKRCMHYIIFREDEYNRFKKKDNYSGN